MYKFTGFACALLLTSPCVAQVTPGTVTTTTTTTAAAPTLRASQILGSTVHLQGTNNFGKVDDIILSDDGGPTYLLVSNGFGGQQVLMPLSAANYDQGLKAVTYNVTPQAVQPLLFAPSAHPNVVDQQFTTRTNQVFPTDARKIKIKERPNGTIKEKIKN